MKSDAPGKTSPLLKPIARALMNMRGTSAGFGLLALPAMALAQMPTGGQVVAGSATIAQPDANNMVVNQGSDKAIINWQGFSIGANGYVQFVQPGSTSVALNRVVGMDPSAILGRLAANGQVFLVNPNGVYFGANATVDVAGIVASTMNIRNEDFLRGDYIFKRDPNAPAGATVINAGSINANGGYVVLAGDYVSNTGVIQANLGTALLASGSALTLQMAGSSLINYAIDEATLAHLAGVDNAGQIMASGGKIIMTAEVANQLAGTVVNNSGLIQAQGTIEKDGAIWLTGKGGDVVNAGTLDASGGQDGKAGQVHMRASGDLMHEAGSLITVDGAKAGAGDAGSIDTWADGKNRFKEGATISGRGGEPGGNGGFVELSGNSVAYRGDLDLRANNGDTGTLLIDPKTITIKNGGGEDIPDQDDATFYEDNLENALGSANVVLLAQNSGAGNTASIHMEDLADDVLGAGGNGSLTLKVEATDGATGSITFEDRNDQIYTGGQLNLSVENTEATGVGSIDVGHLRSDTGIDLKAGSISAESLKVTRSHNEETDVSHAITARAWSGDLNIKGDVQLEIGNLKAGGVATEVDLQAAGKIDIGGKVTSNATGKGYYHYNWVTDDGIVAGANAYDAVYFGKQPWKKTSEGDHAISTRLNIAAGGDVIIGGDVQAVATDTNTSFASAPQAGGYWQTITAKTHNFWRPTAASAEASIAAGGDVDIGGVTTVKADGYATKSYSETESYWTMVQNYNYTTAQQKVWTNYGCISESDGQCTSYGYRDFHYETIDRLKGTAKTGSEKYIWSFGAYRANPPAEAWGVADVPPADNNDFDPSSVAGPMGYSGARGLTATLDINAGKSVTLNGVDVRAVNRSATGSSSYIDVNWGHQDTAAGVTVGNGLQTSANQERDYSDSFTTAYSSPSTDARATITAGEGSDINLNGAANVVAQHTHSSESTGRLDFAQLKVGAGSGEGAEGSTVNINAPVLVEGSSDSSIDLSVRNRDGALLQAGSAGIQVKNNYAAGDASARLISDHDQTGLNATVTVTAGRTATLTAKGATLDTADTLGATGNTSALVDLESTEGNLHAEGAITATGGNAEIKLASENLLTTTAGVTASANAASGAAKVGMNAGTDLITEGAVHATTSGRIGSATVDLKAAGGITNHATVSASGTSSSGAAAATVGMRAGTALTVNAAVTATATHFQYDGFSPNFSISGGDATVNLKSGDGINLNADVVANAYRTAAVSIETDQGPIELAEGKNVSSTAIGNQIAPNYTYSYSATLAMNSHGTIALGGNVSTSAVNGTASTFLNTLGGAGAEIRQDAGTTISTIGRVATQRIKAGNTAGDADNAAGIYLDGTNSVTASLGDATFQVQGSDITLRNFSVSATAGKSQAAISALNGNLNMHGSGSISGNANAHDGARLTFDASGVIITDSASVSVNNTNTGEAAGAILGITGGMLDGDYSALGALSVTGVAAATASINVDDDLDLVGTVSVNATGSDSVAQALVSSNQGSLTVHNGVSVSAQALGTGGSATTTVSGNTGVNINGNLLARAADQATLTVNTTGGATADINQGDSSQIRAEAATATLNVNAGNANPDADNAATARLKGSLVAAARSGAANIGVNGGSVELQTVSAASTDGKAGLHATALNGTFLMDEEGSVLVSGNANAADGAVLALGASGDMDLAYATINVNNASNGVLSGASANLTADGAVSLGAVTVSADQTASLAASSNGNLDVRGDINSSTRGGLPNTSATAFLNAVDGNLTVHSGNLVKSSGTDSATTTLQSTNAMQIDGNVNATSILGTAETRLVTTGGADGGISQHVASRISANGVSASVNIAAGNANPTADNGATFDLAGTVNAEASFGAGSIEIRGKDGTLKYVAATSTGSAASVAAEALDGTLSATGAITVIGNRNVEAGAALNLQAKDTLDVSASDIQVINSSSSSSAGAQAILASSDGGLTVGNINVIATEGAHLNLNADGDMNVIGDLLASSSSDTGNSIVNLQTSTGTLTVDTDASVNSSANYKATATLEGGSGLLINGSVTANGTQGDALVNLTTTGGATAGISQAADTNIAAIGGKTATVQIMSGSTVPTSGDAAEFMLDGTISAAAGSGQGLIKVRGKNGSLNELTASSQSANAAVQAAAVDGSLTLTGDIDVIGNSNTMSGAELNLSASQALNTTDVDLTVTNHGTGAQAGASAILNAGSTMDLGDISLDGSARSVLIASSEGDLTLAGNLDSTTTGTDGSSEIILISNAANVNLQSGTEVNAYSAGDASVIIQGDTGVQVDGDINALGTNGTAVVNILTSGGALAGINQGSDSTIWADGQNATVRITAGGDYPDQTTAAALRLAGTTHAHASNGQASIEIESAWAEINNLQANADTGNVAIRVATVGEVGYLVLSGALDAHGNADSDEGAVVELQANGSLDTTAAVISVSNNSAGEDAKARLGFGSMGDMNLGEITVAGQNAEVTAAAQGDMGTWGKISLTGADSASLELQATGNLNLQSDLEVVATSGMAAASLTSAKPVYGRPGGDGPIADGGNVVQGADYSVLVSGVDSGLNVGAENGTVTLDGSLTAQASDGKAQIEIGGNAIAINDLTASSTSGEGWVTAQAIDGDLTLNGGINVNGNLDDVQGAALKLAASGALNTEGREITVVNNNAGESAGALVILEAGDTMNLGRIDVVGAASSSLTAQSEGTMTIAADLNANANGVNGHSEITLGSNAGSITLMEETSVAATGGSQAILSVTGHEGVQVNGDLTATAAGGDAVLNIASTGGTMASIDQSSASTIKAEGMVATINLAAGSESPNEEDGATLNLAGTVVAHASEGAAAMDLQAGSVTIDGSVQANADVGDAIVYMRTVDPAGNLTVNGNISLNGNSGDSQGVSLIMDARGAIDSTAGTITLTNNSVEDDGGAAATLESASTISLGDISVSGPGTAIVSATSEDRLTVAGDISAGASAEAGTGMIALYSTASNVDLQAGTTVTSNGGADGIVSITAREGMQVDSDISASGSTGTAVVSVVTTGGALAAINQGSAGTISAEGVNAEVRIHAGAEEPEADQAAAINLAGSNLAHATEGKAFIDIQGGSATINNLQASADIGTAGIGVVALDEAGSLTLNGNVLVSANAANPEGAVLDLQSAGSIDTSAAVITVANADTDHEAGARINAVSLGDMTLGQINIDGPQAWMDAYAVQDMTFKGDVAINGPQAWMDAYALQDMTFQGDLAINGVEGVALYATAGRHLNLKSDIALEATEGYAEARLIAGAGGFTVMKTDGDDAPAVVGDLVQDAGRSLTVTGVEGGALAFAENGRVELGGSTVVAMTENAGLLVSGQEVEVKNFSVNADAGVAGAQIAATSGNLTILGTGSVTGAANSSEGALLIMGSQGSIDTRSAGISVSNGSSGKNAGASVAMVAVEGGIQAGAINATTNGGGAAEVVMQARGALALTGDVSAIAAGSGTAAVRLGSATEAESETAALSGTITQSAGKLIKAASDSGDAMVEIQTGNCCSGTVNLAGTVASKVESGEGTASVEIRSNDVTLNNLSANAGAGNGSGVDVKVIASNGITVNGKLDLQANNADATASMALVANALNWNGGVATLSDNNVKIQLAAFDPNRIIGVESDQDFDAVPHTNYSQTMLSNFMGHGAQITFGGEVDRSAFNHSQLSKLVQQAADIHVAGNGSLYLGDVRMVFDTTGTVYYHDSQMSPWSVPGGRIAIYVARPNTNVDAPNVDRYVDRTDNSLQNMTRALENSVFGTDGTPTVNQGGQGPVPGTTHINGNLYMAGNGVNTGVDDGAQPGAGNANGDPAGAAPGGSASAQPDKRDDKDDPTDD